MIGSHNKPPPPSNDGERAFIAAVNGEPEIPLDVPKLGTKEEALGTGILKAEEPEGREPLVNEGGVELTGSELTGAELDSGILDAGKAVGGNPDIILENSTGSIPGGTGDPEAAAAATISAGVGSMVPVITL